MDRVESTLKICKNCGWWQFQEKVTAFSTNSGSILERIYAGTGTLKEFDLMDVEQPIAEVKEFIKLKYHERFNIHPELLENLVASVFRDFGFLAKVTSYHNDGGIDIILENTNGKEIGVQVKPYKSKINVSQIREFSGSLFLKGYTKGIFVTTGTFQSGAIKTANLSTIRGIPIELIDSQKLYDALNIKSTEYYKNIDDWKEITQKENTGRPNLKLIEQTYPFRK